MIFNVCNKLSAQLLIRRLNRGASRKQIPISISDRLLPAGSGRTAKPTQACNSHQNDACRALMNGQNHGQ